VLVPHSIPSAVSAREAQRLAELASGGCVLEVGSDYGFSTIVLASTARCVHAVDWFRGDGHAGHKDVLGQFWTNINQWGVRDKIIVHIGDAAEVVPTLKSGTFDLAFIDAFHEEDAVYQDGMRCYDVVRLGGAIAFHDYGRFTVAPAVERLKHDLHGDLEVVESLAVLRLP